MQNFSRERVIFNCQDACEKSKLPTSRNMLPGPNHPSPSGSVSSSLRRLMNPLLQPLSPRAPRFQWKQSKHHSAGAAELHWIYTRCCLSLYQNRGSPVVLRSLYIAWDSTSLRIMNTDIIREGHSIVKGVSWSYPLLPGKPLFGMHTIKNN